MAESRWTAAAAGALTLLGLALPFPHTGFIRNSLLLTAIGLLIVALRRERRRLTFGPLALGWLVYLPVWLVAALLAVAPGYSLKEYLGEFIFPFLVFLAAVNCFTERTAHRFITLLIWLGVGLSVYGLVASYRHFGWIDFQYYHLFFLMDYKSYGTFFVFLLPYVFLRLLRQWWYALPLGLFLVNLVETYCRSAWVGVAAGLGAALLWFGWAHRRQLGTAHRRKIAAVAGIALLLTVLVATLFIGFGSMGTPVRNLLKAREGWENPLRLDRFRQDPNIAQRLRLWLNAAPMAAARPLWGYGPGIDTFRELYPAYQRPQDELIWHPHNEFYRALLEGGAVGLVALLGLLALLAYYLAIQLRVHPEHARWTVPLLMVVAGFWVRNQFDCHFLDDKQWTFWLLTGMTMAVTARSDRERLTLLSREYPPATGGIGRVAAQLHRRLEQLGTPTAVIAGGTAGPDEPVSLVRIRTCGSGRWSAFGYRFGTLVHLGIDPPTGIIALQWHPEGTIACQARRLYGIPYLVYAHGKEIVSPAPGAARRLRRVLAGAAGTVAVSRATADRLRQAGVPPEQVRIIPNGVTVFPESTAPPPEKEKIILGVGRLVPRKRFDLLIIAAAGIVGSGWRLHLVGDGPERATLERQAGERGLGAGAVFHGTVSDAALAALYRRAAMVVLPAADDETGFEGLGIVLLEGMAFGAVPVGSTSGGIPELIRDGENGALFPAGDGAALARTLHRLAADDDGRRRLGAAARVTASAYSWAANAHRLRDWLRAAASQ